MKPEQLRAILDAHSLWINGEGGAQADLRKADLRSANLRKADLRSANLRWADLSWADLSSANLRWANLRKADLSSADLRKADLRSADLRWADLRWANLRKADLSSANLSWADLSSADGMFDAAAWIAENLKRTRGGVLAYKTFGLQFPSPSGWIIAEGSEIAECVNPLPTLDCACGVNVATLDWCRRNGGSGPIWRVLVRWEWLAAGVIPWGTDGKFRVPRAKLLGIVGPEEAA